jgi:hypothetical protein
MEMTYENIKKLMVLIENRHIRDIDRLMAMNDEDFIQEAINTHEFEVTQLEAVQGIFSLYGSSDETHRADEYKAKCLRLIRSLRGDKDVQAV